MAIDIPVNAPGADASAKSIAQAREEVVGLRKAVESSVAGSKEYYEAQMRLVASSDQLTKQLKQESEGLAYLAKLSREEAGSGLAFLADGFDKLTGASRANASAVEALSKTHQHATSVEGEHARSTESLGKRLGDASRNFNEMKMSVGSVVGGIISFGKYLAESVVAVESHDRALVQLRGAYSAVAEATNGAVTAEEAARVQAQITTAGLHVTADQLAAVTKSAREMSIVTGTDTSQALEQLTQALISGEKDGLRKFNISIGDAKDKNDAFAKGIADLTKKMDAVPTSAQTAAEEMKTLNESWTLFTATVANSIAQMAGFNNMTTLLKYSVEGLKYGLTGDKELGRKYGQQAIDTRALGARMSAGDRAREAGLFTGGTHGESGADALNAQTDQINHVLDMRAQTVAALLHGDAARARALQAEVVAGEAALRGDKGPQYDAPGIQTAARGPGYKTLAEMLKEGGVYESIAAGDKKKRGGRSGASSGGLDPAQLTEMMQTMGILRGELSGSMHDVSGLGQGGGEDTKTYLARAAGALEDVFVDANHRAIRRRGESEIEFAKRRIDLAKSTAETILAEEKRKHEQGLKDEEKALEDARKLTIARQDMKLEAAARRVTLAGAARARSESGGILTSEEAGVGSERSALEEQKQLLQTRHDDLDIRIALESSEERQLALVREKIGVEEQLYGIKSRTRDMEQADRDKQLKNDFGRQLAGKFVADAKNIQTSAQTSADIFKSTSDSIMSGLANQTLAVIQNKKSAGQALRDGLTDLAAATFPRALMEGGLALAGGFAQAAIGNEPGAAMLFAAAAQYGVVAALAGGGAALLAATAPSAASAGGGAAQAARGGSSSLGRTPSANNADNGGGNVFNMYYSGAPMMTQPELHRATQQMIGEAMANAPMHAGTSRALRGELGAR